MEKTNIRYVTREHIPIPIGFASIDVSFISLEKVFGPVQALLAENGQVVSLIKPQCEAGRSQVGQKGVVRDPKIHREVIRRVISYAVDAGFVPGHLEFSPVKGPEGNIEYLLHLYTGADQLGDASEGIDFDGDAVEAVVEAAHRELDRS